MNSEYENAAKKAKKLKSIPTLILICAVVFTVLFHKGNQIGTVVFGFLSTPVSIAIAFAAFLAALFLYHVAVSSAGKILTDECDPLKYLYVYENVFFKKNKPLTANDTVSLCMAAEAAGDHEGACRYAEDLIGSRHEFYGRLTQLRAAYVKEETERIPELYEAYRNSVARTGKEKMLAGQMVFAGMLKDSAACETDGTNFAELLDVKVGKPLVMTVRGFYTGLVFYRAGFFEKAAERFEAAVKHGGKTWYRTESERILNLIREQKG